MFQPDRCQATGTLLISTETNNEDLLIARQRFRTTDISTATVDRGGYKRRGDSFTSLFYLIVYYKDGACGMLPKRPKFLRQIGHMFQHNLSFGDVTVSFPSFT
jgi:hypothetical protein